MKTIDFIFIEFVEKLKTILAFISENFGDKEILIRKNKGYIPDRNLEIKNSPIKSYIFHGNGCDFRFKENILDVEFENDNIGFTGWSFYIFATKYNTEITEEVVYLFLKEKIQQKKLKYKNRIYELYA